MINERICLIWRRIRLDIRAAQHAGCQAALEGDFAMTGMTAFLIAVGGVSMICFWLMTRVQNRAARRASSTADNADSGSYDSGSGSWNIASWFSSENCSSDSSGTSGASGSWDSGGSDGGGGGDGGGGD
jgi:hypothetical protein